MRDALDLDRPPLMTDAELNRTAAAVRRAKGLGSDLLGRPGNGGQRL